MKKTLSTVLLALLGLALPATAQVQASYNDLILGFRATGGQGQNINLEVNLGSVALYTNPAASPVVITRLAAADLTGTYGATWNSRADLVWGIVGTAGRVSGGPSGQPAATLWASKPETTVGTQSVAWTPGSRNGQTNASAGIETLVLGAPGSLNGASISPNSSYAALINGALTGSYTSQDTFQAGTSFGFFNPSIDGAVTVGPGTYSVLDLYELQPGASASTYIGSFGLSSNGTLTFSTSAAFFAGGAAAPAVTTQPASQSASAGGAVTLTAAASGSPTYQWQQNGSSVAGATSATLSLANVQPANAGVYTAVITNSSGSATTLPAIVGVTTASKVIGAGTEILSNQFVAFNNNTFDQVALQGAAATITADPQQITRMSFIDLNDDIVQVEFSGAGTLSLVLDAATGPAAPVKYNQPGVTYYKGQAGIIIVGANETTNLSVFTVGSITAVNQALFPSGVTYDGVADIAFIAISSANGKFGGIRASDASLWSTKGITGLYAPGVEFTGPVFLGDINAMTSATPYLQIGKADVEVRITGGDLKIDNGRAIQASGLTQVHFKDGTTSAGTLIPAQANKGQLIQGGVDVTSQVVLAPGL